MVGMGHLKLEVVLRHVTRNPEHEDHPQPYTRISVKWETLSIRQPEGGTRSSERDAIPKQFSGSNGEEVRKQSNPFRNRRSGLPFSSQGV